MIRLHGLRKRWFLLALLVLIPGGMWLGAVIDWRQLATRLGGGSLAARAVDNLPRISTVIVLFLMSFSLDSAKLVASFRSPGPVLWASFVNLALVPLAAWALLGFQHPADFRVGLMIAAGVPCTLAAASVWTRKAGGNDAVSLMVTLSTNAVCFAVTPFWLKLTTGSAIQFDTADMMLRLVQAVLIPTILGQIVRQAPAAGRFAARHKTPIGVVAQVLILVIVFLAACKAGVQLSGFEDVPSAGAIAVVWMSCILLHAAALLVAASGARLLGYAREDRIAVAFAASQKTLPIGVLLATDPAMFGNADLGVPFAVFPMLMYHASQLFIDTAVADRMAAVVRPSAAIRPETEPPVPPVEA
jgi:sodium/bile acid cotransporter 7